MASPPSRRGAHGGRGADQLWSGAPLVIATCRGGHAGGAGGPSGRGHARGVGAPCGGRTRERSATVQGIESPTVGKRARGDGGGREMREIGGDGMVENGDGRQPSGQD